MALLKKFELTPKFNRKVVVVAAFIIVPLLVLEIWTMNRLSTLGQGIAELESSKEHLELENTVLRNKISEKRSLTETAQKAKSLGFTKVDKIEYISKEQPGLALNK